MKEENKKIIVTHDSSFHTDDTFAVAVLLMMYPQAEVMRSRDPEAAKRADFVVDVGLEHDPVRGLFDHHQPGGAGERPNGIPYASFGLVWKEFGANLAGGKREAEVVDRRLAQPIDAHDNGLAIAEYNFENIREYTIGDFLYSFLAAGAQKPDELYEVFMHNVGLAKGLLEREIINAKDYVQGVEIIKKCYDQSDDKRIIEIPGEGLPWQDVFAKLPEPLFVVYPRRDGMWGIRAMPDKTKPYGFNRKDLPSAWGGRAGEELANITGVKDAKFAHRALFMAAALSKEGALELARIALKD